MAKKQPKEEPLAERIETAMRDAVAAIPGINGGSELAYCEALAAACDAIKTGAEMRISELDPEDDG